MTGDGKDELATVVRGHEAELEVWEAAELHLMEQAFRDRLAELRVAPSPDVAAALMAVATFLAPHVDEWDGDARDALREVALLGLRLLEAGEADRDDG